MDEPPIIFIIIAVCFIIMISISIYNFVRIGNLKNKSADLELSLKNVSDYNVEQKISDALSNITKVKTELSEDIMKNIQKVQAEQSNANTIQDTLITKNQNDITLVQSNIDNVIKPKLGDFDGNFKSLEGAIESNKSEIKAVGTSITQLSTQFNTQHEQLSDEIKRINATQFEDKIGKLQAAQTQIQSELVGININKQSIANNKAAIDDLYSNLINLNDVTSELADVTVDLAKVVDGHDLILKAL